MTRVILQKTRVSGLESWVTKSRNLSEKSRNLLKDQATYQKSPNLCWVFSPKFITEWLVIHESVFFPWIWQKTQNDSEPFPKDWSCDSSPKKKTRAQVYPKVGNCHNTCKNFKIQFSRQKFEFDFLAPKMSYFSIFLGSLNFALKQSGLNKKMPPIKLSR